jgi:NADP-reducing hydrogenase subunit HndC
LAPRRFKIIVCRGPECGDRRGSRLIAEALDRELTSQGLRGNVELAWQSCFGRCTQGPNALVREVLQAPTQAPPRFAFATLPVGTAGKSALYNRLRIGDIAELVSEHIGRGQVVRRLIEPIEHRRDPAPEPPRAEPSAEPALPVAPSTSPPETPE